MLGCITISLEEYKSLLDMQTRVNVFAEHVKNEKYIEKEDCAKFLGFSLKNNEGVENNE